MLFHETIFGPIHSRRLGSSLGINLLPTNGKICSFDCIYCECGFNSDNTQLCRLPTPEEVHELLEQKLQALQDASEHIDVLTFAGNGEPSLHPNFKQIIEDTIGLRNRYYPKAKVSVLSNATCIQQESVYQALQLVDNNILKLDSAVEDTVALINQPNDRFFSIEKTIQSLASFNGHVIIQTLFFSGHYNGHFIDNTSRSEVDAWLKALHVIRPKQVMIYSLDRATPAQNLIKASPETLTLIAEKVKALGIETLLTL